MVNVIKGNVNVTLVGRVINAINFLVTPDVLITGNVETVLAYVAEDGMANIVLLVNHLKHILSIYQPFYSVIKYMQYYIMILFYRNSVVYNCFLFLQRVVKTTAKITEVVS